MHEHRNHFLNRLYAPHSMMMLKTVNISSEISKAFVLVCN
jgi:hypothetical protein